MKLQLENTSTGMASAELLTSLVAENQNISAVYVFTYKHPPLLQQRLALTADESVILAKAVTLRSTSSLPFWESVMLSCFGESRDSARLLNEATFHQSHRDSLIRISRSDVCGGRLINLVEAPLDGQHLSFSSKVEFLGICSKHLPLLDFHCPESTDNDRLVSAVCKQLFHGATLVFTSGESYHAIGLELLDEVDFRKFLTRCIFFAPIIDTRYVAHQLLEGTCALRLSNSKHKPKRPSLKFIVSPDVIK